MIHKITNFEHIENLAFLEKRPNILKTLLWSNLLDMKFEEKFQNRMWLRVILKRMASI